MNFEWIFIIIILVLYLYNDFNYRKRLQKKDDFIKDLEIKFMSRDVSEYMRTSEEEIESVEEAPDQYIPLEDLEARKTIEEIERAEFKA